MRSGKEKACVEAHQYGNTTWEKIVQRLAAFVNPTVSFSVTLNLRIQLLSAFFQFKAPKKRFLLYRQFSAEIWFTKCWENTPRPFSGLKLITSLHTLKEEYNIAIFC